MIVRKIYLRVGCPTECPPQIHNDDLFTIYWNNRKQICNDCYAPEAHLTHKVKS